MALFMQSAMHISLLLWAGWEELFWLVLFQGKGAIQVKQPIVHQKLDWKPYVESLPLS